MPREDLGAAESAPAPLMPLSESTLDADVLAGLGRRVAQRTWELGIDRWFWGEGVALLGLVHFGSADAATGTERVRSWFDHRLGEELTIEHVNDLAPGIAALVLDGGADFASRLAPLVAWTRSDRGPTRSASGALEHWPGALWADTMLMAGAFLARYAVATKDEELLGEAGHQWLSHAEVLQEERSGLFAHGSYRQQTLWNMWGRANAWAALSAVELLESAQQSSRASAWGREIKQRLGAQLQTLSRLQPEHGVWDVLVDGPAETTGILETSAAAGLAAAMLRAAQLLPDKAPELSAAGGRALRGALAYLSTDGTLTRVSAGTILQLLPYGYSVIRNDLPQPWGQGLALEAIAAGLAHARGASEVNGR